MLTTFIELLEDQGVYNFRIIKKEITPPNGFNPFDDDYEVIPPDGFDQMENPFDDDDEVIPPDGFDQMEDPFDDDDDEVIPPNGFDRMENPFDDDDDEVIPSDSFDQMEELFNLKEYEYYAAYTDYKDSTGQRIFKILNLKELISLITKDLLVIRGHLDLDLSNFSSLLEEIVER